MTTSGNKLVKSLRRPFRERPQPLGRQRLGLLEKHRDYVQRARNFNAKRKTIKHLQEKARLRNPDEFYFKMQNSKMEDGKHTEDRSTNLEHDVVRVLKSQDAGYVQLKHSQEMQKIERLKSGLQFIGGSPSGPEDAPRHTVFVEEEEEARTFDVAKHFNTHPSLVGRSFNRPRLETIDEMDVASVKPSKIAKARSKAYKELESRLDRADKLAEASAELRTQKLIMGNGSRKRVGTDKRGNAIYKWANKRLR